MESKFPNEETNEWYFSNTHPPFAPQDDKHKFVLISSGMSYFAACSHLNQHTNHEATAYITIKWTH